MIQCLSIVLAVLAAVSGFVGAIYWYRASRFRAASYSDFEPVDIEGKIAEQSGVLARTIIDLQGSARLNKMGALWTALAVALGAMFSLIGCFS